MSTQKTGKLRKNLPTLIILIISGAFVYALPYFRSYYYDTFVTYFNLTNTQMGALGSAYGGFAIIAYFLGGLCADRWRAKNLLTLSLVTTGGLGFILLLYPPYPVLLAIHAIWGITTILTFWNALIKAIRMLGTSEEQGRVFGLFEGGRGITNMVQSALILTLFGVLSVKISDKAALSSVILVYSAINVLLGIFVYFMYKEQEYKKESKAFVDIPTLKKVLKLPTTWLQGLIIFCSYAMCCSYFYITPYSTSVFGATAVIGAAIGYFSQYCRPIGCFTAGFAADRISSSKVCLIAYSVMLIGILGVILIPGQPSLIWMLLVFIAAIYVSMYACQSMHFAIMEEGDYPHEATGTATAIITPIGYSVELFAPIVAGLCLDHWAGAAGYKVFFTILAGVVAIGLIATLVWMKLTKEKRTEIMEERRAQLQAKKQAKEVA